jgi:hypothetical protein
MEGVGKMYLQGILGVQKSVVLVLIGISVRQLFVTFVTIIVFYIFPRLKM